MSDTIIINTNPIPQDSVVINTGGSNIISVNGKIGLVVLTPADLGLDQINNTSDLNKPISLATLSALLLKTDLSAFNILNTFIVANSANWNSVYVTVNTLSANFNLGYQSISTVNNLSLSSVYWNNIYSNFITNSAKWNLGYQAVSTVNNLSLSSVYWNSVYSTVYNTSGTWGLGGGGGSAYITQAVSGVWQSTSTTVSSFSANWNLGYQAVSTVNNLSLSSVYWNSTYTTFNANSASLTILYSNSANWNLGYQSVSTVNNLNVSSVYWNNAYNNAVFNINGTANQIVATKSTSPGNNSYTLSFPTSAVFPGDVSIIGNLTISGSATYINAQNLVVGDNLIYLNNNNTGNVLDTGFVSHFTQSPLGYQHTGLVRKAGQGKPGVWTLFSGLTTEPLSAANIDWTDRNMVVDSLSANLIGNVTGNASTVTNGVYTTDVGTVTNTMLAGNIADNKISSSSNWNLGYQAISTVNNLSLSSIYWNNVYSNFIANSSNWNLGYQAVSTVNNLSLSSIYWNNVYSTVYNTSGTWGGSGGGGSAYITPSVSGIWQSTSTTVSSFSANWTLGYQAVSTVNNVFSVFTTNSANFKLGYQAVSTVNTLSLSSIYWNSVYTLINTTTATTFNANNLITTGKIGVKQTPNYFDLDVNSTIGNSNGTFGIGSLQDVTIYPNNKLLLTPVGNILATASGDTTSIPNEKLTVVGNISSTSIVYANNGNSNKWNSVYTTVNTTSAVLTVNDQSSTYTITVNDNNKAVHLDTTSTTLSALFPSTLIEGFSVALMNTGTNYLYLSSALPLVSIGNSLSGKGSGAFAYVHNGSLYAVGRF
jgi:hypothetical protein